MKWRTVEKILIPLRKDHKKTFYPLVLLMFEGHPNSVLFLVKEYLVRNLRGMRLRALRIEF
jgi:hypothetical protein